MKQVGALEAALARERQEKEQQEEAERTKQLMAALPLTVESVPTISVEGLDKYIPTRQGVQPEYQQNRTRCK